MKSSIPVWITRLVLVLICLAAMGSAFQFDFPQVFEATLINTMGIDAHKVQFLYSIGSVPNLFSNVLASLILPKLGVGVIVLIFQAIAFAGASLTFLAIRANDYEMLWIGRIFIGMSGDLCYFGMILVCEKWFRGRLLSLSFGLGRFWYMVGSSMSFYLLPKIYLSSRSLEMTAFSCVVVCFLMFSCMAIFTVLDHIYGDLLEEKQEEGGSKQVEEREDRLATLDASLNADSVLSFELQKEENELKKDEDRDRSTTNKKEFRLKDLRHINSNAWGVVVFIILIPNIYFQFTNTGSDLLTSRYGLSYKSAKNTLSILPLIGGILTPITSAFYTNYGLKPAGLLFSTILALSAYSFFALLPMHCGASWITLGLVLLGLHYGVNFGCMWTCLLQLVPKQASSLILGLTLTFQNIFFTVIPILASFIYEERTPEAYQNWLYFMIGFALLAAGFASKIFFFGFEAREASDAA